MKLVAFLFQLLKRRFEGTDGGAGVPRVNLLVATSDLSLESGRVCEWSGPQLTA